MSTVTTRVSKNLLEDLRLVVAQVSKESGQVVTMKDVLDHLIEKYLEAPYNPVNEESSTPVGEAAG